MKVTCKCHGVSGSCSLITCWQQLAPFRKVGDHLQDKYGDATRVKTTRSGRLRVRRKASNIPIPTANDLVFLHRSPNYCHHNDTIGSLGEFSLLMNELANMNASGSHFSCSLGIGDRIWWGPFVQGDQFNGDRLSRGTASGGPEVRGSNGFGTKCVAA